MESQEKESRTSAVSNAIDYDDSWKHCEEKHRKELTQMRRGSFCREWEKEFVMSKFNEDK